MFCIPKNNDEYQISKPADVNLFFILEVHLINAHITFYIYYLFRPISANMFQPNQTFCK